MANGIPDFDNRGLLPDGEYYPLLEEFKERFVFTNDITTRTNLYEKYKEYCLLCLDNGSLSRHYIGGSYVTVKEHPGDIDLLVVFIGLSVDQESDEFLEIYNDREGIHNEYSCHAWCVLEYSQGDVPEELYDHLNDVKNTVISWWHTNYLDEGRTVVDPIPKGVIVLTGEEIEKIRSS